MDADSRNQEWRPGHPTIKHSKQAMTKGQRQEIGSRWLEETMLDKEATAPEAISDGSEGNEKRTNTSRTTRQPQLAKELRTCTQTAMEAKVRQAP